jgi:Domain of unknown function (DUF4398)
MKIKPNPDRPRALTLAGCAFIAVGMLASVGCASVSRVPSDAFQAADIAITNADKEQASDFAPNELALARSKIAAAKAAVDKNPREKDIVKARQLAEQARSDAELASARARDGRAQAVNAELQKNNDTLREELQRNSGDGQ